MKTKQTDKLKEMERLSFLEYMDSCRSGKLMTRAWAEHKERMAKAGIAASNPNN